MADNSVAEPTEEYKALAPFWQMIRDIRAGTAAMRLQNELYLPRHPAEPEQAFENRVARSVFTNFYKKITGKLIGKPLKDPIVLEDDVPDSIEALMDNVDLLGNDLNVFARNVLEAAVDDGSTHILVDFPATREQMQGAFPGGELTLQQERESGVRPYAIHIRPRDLIGWKWDVDANGSKRLTQIRFKEAVKEADPDDEFSQVIRERIRVYDAGTVDSPGLVRIYQKQEGGGTNSGRAGEDEWVRINAFTATFVEIPLVTMYTNRVGFLIGTPWLLDMAYLNVAHWQSDSDQRNIVHVARVPILFGTGLDQGAEGQASFTLEVGPSTMTRAAKGATLAYVELEGKSIEAGQKDLDDLEERMEALGVSVLVKRPTGSETATGDIIASAEEESELGLVARELESTLENMLDLFAFWLKIPSKEGGSVTVFKDFGVTMGSDKDLTHLQKDRIAGDISILTYWREMKRRGILTDDFDEETELQLLALESEREAVGSGLQPEEEATLNEIGDETGSTDAHTHTLQGDGWTSEVNGHRHRWTPEGTRTSIADEHDHELTRRAAAVAAMETEDDEEDEEDGEIERDEGQNPPAGGPG